MAELRVITAILLFSLSSYLIYDLFANGFNWLILLTAIAGYWLVHLIWPKHSSEESAWYDIFELFVDLPYRCIALFIRSIGKAFRSGDGDIGVDL